MTWTLPGPNRRRKGRLCEGGIYEPHDLPVGRRRRGVGLLPRGGPAGPAHHPAAARLPVLLADVGAAADPAGRRFPPHRAGLPGLRPQRRARPVRLRLHLRPPGRDHRALHRTARPGPVHPVHAGLRRPDRLPAGDRAPGPGAGDDRAERGRARGRARPAVGHPPGVLGGPPGPRGGAARELLLARRHQAAARRQQPGPAAVRPGPVDRRARLPRPARPARHPGRPVLRLPHQRRQLPGLAAMAAGAPAAAAGGVGPLRPVLPDRRGRGLPPGRARRRDPSPRRRPLRPRRAARPDRRAHPPIPALTRNDAHPKRALTRSGRCRAASSAAAAAASPRSRRTRPAAPPPSARSSRARAAGSRCRRARA
jgi:hypothetical protein